MPNIIHIETSTSVCSAALSSDGVVQCHFENFEGPSHASLLGVYVKQIMDFSRDKGVKVDAVAVSSGPGSYTGLRIGVSEAKGLCFGLKVPLISVPTLELLACTKKRLLSGNGEGNSDTNCPTTKKRPCKEAVSLASFYTHRCSSLHLLYASSRTLFMSDSF